MLEATIKRMRSVEHKEYVQQIELYKGCALGIYDDTADLSRAIAYADAYFGDAPDSSLLWLCKAAGKPAYWSDSLADDDDAEMFIRSVVQEQDLSYKDCLVYRQRDDEINCGQQVFCESMHRFALLFAGK